MSKCVNKAQHLCDNYHFILHSSFELESPLTGAPPIDDQHGVAQRRQRAQPQVLHTFIRVIH